MNIGFSTLQRWLRQYRDEQQGVTPKVSSITSEQQRIQELEAQVKQLKSDNDLLKKAPVSSSDHCNALFNRV